MSRYCDQRGVRVVVALAPADGALVKVNYFANLTKIVNSYVLFLEKRFWSQSNDKTIGVLMVTQPTIHCSTYVRGICKYTMQICVYLSTQLYVLSCLLFNNYMFLIILLRITVILSV